MCRRGAMAVSVDARGTVGHPGRTRTSRPAPASNARPWAGLHPGDGVAARPGAANGNTGGASAPVWQEHFSPRQSACPFDSRPPSSALSAPVASGMPETVASLSCQATVAAGRQ